MMTSEQIKDINDQIQYLEIQINIIECKEFLNDEDHELLNSIHNEIKKLKLKLK